MDALATALTDSWIAAATRDELASALRWLMQQQPERAALATVVARNGGSPRPKSLQGEN